MKSNTSFFPRRPIKDQTPTYLWISVFLCLLTLSSAHAKTTIRNIHPYLVGCQELHTSIDASGRRIVNPEEVFYGDMSKVKSLSLDRTQFDCDDFGANTVTLSITQHDGTTSS